MGHFLSLFCPVVRLVTSPAIMNPMYALLLLLPSATLGMNCTGQPDGNYEIGCRSYAKCSGGKNEIVTCDVDMAYNQGTGVCDDATNVAPPCGVKMDCTSLSDGKYADTNNGCKVTTPAWPDSSPDTTSAPPTFT